MSENEWKWLRAWRRWRRSAARAARADEGAADELGRAWAQFAARNELAGRLDRDLVLYQALTVLAGELREFDDVSDLELAGAAALRRMRERSAAGLAPW